MSYSSLYTIDKEYFGEELKEYQNSWLFSPTVLNMLFWKHLPEKSYSIYDKTQRTNYITAMLMQNEGEEPVFRQLNNIMNDSENLTDRIMWEFCNQQIFFVKNKEIVSNAILKFLEENPIYDEEPVPDHVVERFKEIADDIKNLDDTLECFVFKNSSCDDGVEYWFYGWDEEEEEDYKVSLKEKMPQDAEFVDIKDNTMEFYSINEMFQN